ncbi:MAG: hypothetical protein LUH16_06905, partial [Clostridiales bacterium]|nr:hypothetical protein [Clostridiales bacterium]
MNRTEAHEYGPEGDSWRCPRCGQWSYGDSFCSECGFDHTSDLLAHPTLSWPVPRTASASPDEMQSAENGEAVQKRLEQERRRKTRSRRLIVALVLLALLCAQLIPNLWTASGLASAASDSSDSTGAEEETDAASDDNESGPAADETAAEEDGEPVADETAAEEAAAAGAEEGAEEAAAPPERGDGAEDEDAL